MCGFDALAALRPNAGFGRFIQQAPLRVTDEPDGGKPKAVVDSNGQRSVSHVTVVDRRAGASLVGVRLETGRTHQIRAHLLAVGHPLLGDPRVEVTAAHEPDFVRRFPKLRARLAR